MKTFQRAYLTVAAFVLPLIAASAAQAATFTADPSISDTNAASACTNPCALRQAIADANASSAESVVKLETGTYKLTLGALNLNPMANAIEILEGEGTLASQTTITAGGSSQVLTVGSGGGDVAIAQVEVTGGNGGGTSQGGDIAVSSGGNLFVVDSEVEGGQIQSNTGKGGGIYTDGELFLFESLIADNKVLGDNGPTAGGGIDIDQSGNAVIDNSTVADNTISSGGPNTGAGISNDGTATIVSSTIAGNSFAGNSGSGGGLAGSSPATIANTIISNNAGSECATPAPTSDGGDIADDGSCSLNAQGDQPSTDPLLAGSPGALTLTNNGGPTDTIALQSNSPAIDRADTDFCPTEDQREFTRPDVAGTPCDVGAYEFGATGPPTPVVTAVSPRSGPLAGGNTVTITGSDLNQVTGVSFGSTAATNVAPNSAGTQITATAPAGSGTVDVTVSTSQQVGLFSVQGLTSATTPADLYTYPLPPPVLGKAVNVKPVSGHVFIKLPGGKAADRVAGATLSKGQGFIPLTEARQLPAGTQVDGRQGTLQLTSATGQHGKTQTGTFGGAIFGIAQDGTGVNKGLTTLALLEGAFPGAPTYATCKAHNAADGRRAQAAGPSGNVLQTLHGSDNHGHFRTRGRYSSATVRGTIWTVSDRCDGTLTHVQRGTVIVTVPATRKTITLHAGQSYLARAITQKRR